MPVTIRIMALCIFLVPSYPAHVHAQESPPCSGTTWHVAPNPAVARSLVLRALGIKALADSSVRVLTEASPNGEYEDATPEFYTGPAEIARRAAAYAPDDQFVLIAASRLALRAATLGEGRVDTVLAKRAQCYARRAAELPSSAGSTAQADSARALLRAIEMDLDQERRAARAEQQQQRRP